MVTDATRRLYPDRVLDRARVLVESLAKARLRQLRARAVEPVNRSRRGRPVTGSLRILSGAEALWRGCAFATADGAAVRLADGQIELPGARVAYPPADWHAESLTRLQRFHLHYGEEVLGAARSADWGVIEPARAGVNAWIEANPHASRRRSDAWHPYPLSTRIGNWLAAVSLEPSFATAAIGQSLRLQLAYLERNVEHGVLGNHLIRNARALALGGAAFGDGRLVGLARALLRRELREQVLPDGGHYERSPVYHLLVLRDLLEIRAALETDEVDEVIGRMGRFAAALARPDGAPALFNDGGLDLAPDLHEHLPAAREGLAVFPKTGYAVVRGDNRWLAVDCGPPAPAYLPAHAHADALSFQLWMEGRPLVVDPGTYTYDGPDRDWFRSTAAHSTVSVDGVSQFAFWGPFRAGRLPRVELLEATGDAAEGHVLAVVSGFPGVSGGVTHQRLLSWRADGSVEVEDQLRGGRGGRHRVASTLPLAPGESGASAGATCEGATVVELPRRVSERFYAGVEAAALVAELETTLPAGLRWRIAQARSVRFRG